MNYYNRKSLEETNFDNALDKVVEALKKENFGVLTEIDVTTTFKNKLDIDFRNYRILGACNPSYAHKALQAEGNIGVLLPCNVVVEQEEDGTIFVSIVNPIASMMAVRNAKLEPIAGEIEQKLTRVLNSL